MSCGLETFLPYPRALKANRGRLGHIFGGTLRFWSKLAPTRSFFNTTKVWGNTIAIVLGSRSSSPRRKQLIKNAAASIKKRRVFPGKLQTTTENAANQKNWGQRTFSRVLSDMTRVYTLPAMFTDLADNINRWDPGVITTFKAIRWVYIWCKWRQNAQKGLLAFAY